MLLDTVTFLWILADSKELTKDTRLALTDSENRIFLSTASTWEIAVKHMLGKLPLPQAPAKLIPSQRRARGILTLPIDDDAVLRLPQIPRFHKDPFDRILVCQAIEHDMTIVTPDPLLRAYPVRTLW